MFLRIAARSLVNRRGSVVLTILAMTVSIFVLLGVEHIRHQAKSSFENTVSGVDLIVGARTGSTNLLMYSIFRIGAPTNEISWKSYQKIAKHSKVKWAVPISLGDSHKGYRVMGTSTDYFTYFSYGEKRKLVFAQGKPFSDIQDVVLGATVADALGYKLGDSLVLAHGVSAVSFSMHDDRPFKVVGILEPTGTPVDQTLHVSLAGIEAIHANWQNGVKTNRKVELTPEQLTPKTITAFMVGLKRKLHIFGMQRAINNYKKEPLTAILPGVALSELWETMAILEGTLRLVSALVFVAALLGLSAMLLASIRERRQEIRLLRIVGASPGFMFLLIQLEALLIVLISIALGAGALFASVWWADSYLISTFGLHISTNIVTSTGLNFMVAIVIAALVAASVPALQAYRGANQQ